MGAGYHGGFSNTHGSAKKKIFTRVQFEGSVKVDGVIYDVSRRVYQRDDIDFEYVDVNTGMTNLQRMKKGRPPIGSDGKPVQLHHVLQKESGPMVEIREVTHQEYYKILHGIIGSGSSFRNNSVLNKQYQNFRSAYWKWRAKSYGGN